MNKLELKIPPPLILLFCAGGMFLSTLAVPYFSHTFSFQAAVCAALSFMALVFLSGSIRAFIKAKTTIHPQTPERTTALISTGLFTISRNPIYVGLLLLLTAFAVWLGNVMSLLWLGVFVGYITRFQIIPEETALAERFGQTYLDYKIQVRRWL